LWNYIKRVIRENKVATVIGILIGGVGTRFLEDGNLLVTTVLTGMSTVGVLAIRLFIGFVQFNQGNRTAE
jgi:hypothetical protein